MLRSAVVHLGFLALAAGLRVPGAVGVDRRAALAAAVGSLSAPWIAPPGAFAADEKGIVQRALSGKLATEAGTPSSDCNIRWKRCLSRVLIDTDHCAHLRACKFILILSSCRVRARASPLSRALSCSFCLSHAVIGRALRGDMVDAKSLPDCSTIDAVSKIDQQAAGTLLAYYSE